MPNKNPKPARPAPKQTPLAKAAQQQTLPPGVKKAEDGAQPPTSDGGPTMEQLQRANLELQMMLSALGEEKNYWMNQAIAARAQIQQLSAGAVPADPEPTAG